MKHIRKKIVTSDNLEISYVLAPSQDTQKNSAIILLHGLGGSSEAWEKEQRQLHLLGYTTYAIDLRGHGYSGHPKNETDYTIDKFASDIKNIIEHENIRNVTLVGHCFGGMVAIGCATNYPDLIQKLVLIDTSYKPAILVEKYVDKRFLAKILTSVAKITPIWHQKKYMNFSEFIGTSDYDKKRFFQDIMHTSLRSYLFSLNTVFSFDARNKLKKISAKTLVITGYEDSVFRPTVATYIAQKIKKAQLVKILNANHILIINNPKEVVESIVNFLESKKYSHSH